MTDPKQAEKYAKLRSQQAIDGPKAMAEYQQERVSLNARTVKLKELRLAKEAADAQAETSAAAAAKAKAARATRVKTKAAAAKAAGAGVKPVTADAAKNRAI